MAQGRDWASIAASAFANNQQKFYVRIGIRYRGCCRWNLRIDIRIRTLSAINICIRIRIHRTMQRRMCDYWVFSNSSLYDTKRKRLSSEKAEKQVFLKKTLPILYFKY